MSKNMHSQSAVQVDEFPYDPGHPFQHAGRAMLKAHNDTGSKVWNRYLASLPPQERKQAAKAARSALVYTAPSCYWPKPKSFPRGSVAGAAKGGAV